MDAGSFPRDGRVMRAKASTFAGLEATARKEVEGKGVFFDRGGTHRHEKQMTQWLREQKFTDGEFAHGQLLVAPQLAEEKKQEEEGEKCDDKDCTDASCQDGATTTTTTTKEAAAPVLLAGPAEIRAACEELVADLPASFRDAVCSDAEDLATMSVRLCPKVPWLTLRLEVVQYDACWRWHQDGYTGRSLITYVGPGTMATDDKSVRWDEFEKRKFDETNETCVLPKDIKQMQTNAVLLMKGDAWPGIRGKGLTHKSPDNEVQDDDEHEEEGLTKRLLLKVDLNDFRPPLQFDDEEESELDEEEEEEGGEEEGGDGAGGAGDAGDAGDRSPAVKRLADSQDTESADNKKVPRRR